MTLTHWLTTYSVTHTNTHRFSRSITFNDTNHLNIFSEFNNFVHRVIYLVVSVRPIRNDFFSFALFSFSSKNATQSKINVKLIVRRFRSTAHQTTVYRSNDDEDDAAQYQVVHIYFFFSITNRPLAFNFLLCIPNHNESLLRRQIEKRKSLFVRGVACCVDAFSFLSFLLLPLALTLPHC